jgi:multidrug resistance efflux pump
MRPELSREAEILKIKSNSFIIVNKADDRRIQCSQREVELLSLIDGSRTLQQICDDYTKRTGQTLAVRHLQEFLNQLIEVGLLFEADASGAGKQRNRRRDYQSQTWINRRIDWVEKVVGWALHPAALIPVFLLIVLATTIFIKSADVMWEQFQLAAADYGLFLVLLIFLGNVFVVTLPREILMGVACRKFSGHIASIRLYFFRHLVPYFFCDLQDSLARISRRGQLTLLVLRPLSNLVLVSIAAILWKLAPSGSTISLFILIVMTAAIISVLVMLNPFGRGDGYMLISYHYGIQDLRNWAMSEARNMLLFRPGNRACSEHRRFWLRIYGSGIYIFQLLWFSFIIGLIGWLLISRFEGFGVLLFITLLIWWYRDSIENKFVKIGWYQKLVKVIGKERADWLLRLSFVGIVILIGFVPYDYEVSGQVRLMPIAQQAIRAQIEDEIQAIHVEEGDLVQKGDIIATLAGREERAAVQTTLAELAAAKAQLELLEAGTREEDIIVARQRVEEYRIQQEFQRSEVERLKVLDQSSYARKKDLDETIMRLNDATNSIALAEANLEKAINGPRPFEVDAARAEVNRLEALLEHNKVMLSLCEIRSNITGQVVTVNTLDRVGNTVAPGDLILVVQDTSSLEAEIAAQESAAGQIEPGMPVEIRLRGLDGQLLSGKVARVSMIAVKESNFQVDLFRTDREAQLELQRQTKTDKKIRIYAALEEQREGLVPGMSGTARIYISSGTLWGAIAKPILRFIRVDVWSWLP